MPARVGILGGGQLGLMMALAARSLDVGCRFYEVDAAVPAARVGNVITGSFDDYDRLTGFAAGLEAVTYEFENVPVAAARTVNATAPVFPPPLALEVTQDRLTEKQFVNNLGIATVNHAAVDSHEDLLRAVEEIGLPAILKTRRLGYDGKGQATIMTPDDMPRAWEFLAGVPLILEQRMTLGRELSVIAARARDGSIVQYPLVENRHESGILRISTAPAAGVTAAAATTAHGWMDRILKALDYVGVLAIELFEVNGTLLVNELAPRVHNSGHWTIEGAVTSQFENHIRAILGVPLGLADAVGYSRMINVIGTLPATEAVLAHPYIHLHLYGKAPRPDRKLGHITVQASDPEELEHRCAAILQAIAPLLDSRADGDAAVGGGALR